MEHSSFFYLFTLIENKLWRMRHLKVMGKRKKDRARGTKMIERMMKYDSEITKRLG